MMFDATADTAPATGAITASVTLNAPPERVFQALSGPEICDWWVRPGVFDTSDWRGDVRVGGKWSASGTARGQPYALEGEFLAVEAPHRLVQSWQSVGAPGEPSRLGYHLQPQGSGTRLVLEHTGIGNAEIRENTRAGWLTSLQRLAAILA